MLRPNSLTFILFVGGLLAFGPLTLEMYVPTLPLVSAAFGVGPGATQLTVSVYLAGFAIGQLVSGPLVDVFGRRPLLLGGMVLLAGASAVCIVAPSIETLTLARFVQALAVSVGQVAGRAVIRDTHDPVGTARMLAFTMVVIGLTSAITPVAGGFLAVWLGWEIVFAVHAAMALIFFVLIWRRFVETVPVRETLARQVAVTRRGIARLVADRTFLSYTASICFMFGSIFTFISAGAFMFVDVLGMAPAHFGFVFTAISGMLAIGSFLAGSLARRFNRRRMFFAAAVAVAIINVAMAVLGWSGAATIPLLIVLLGAIGFAMGFVVALAMAGALEPHPQVAGTASALIGFSQGTFAAAMSAVAGLLFDGTVLSVVLPMAVLALGVPLSFVLLAPRRMAAD
ncbi:MAG: multidrug effflux MFS transporter [Proteobacteria bacterium]|nr:multidrug effflux MFS transporter [Pseudomonadota bacterium]